MQEEVNQKTVALVFQAVRFSGTVLKKAIVAYLNKHKESAAKSAAAKNAKAEERGSPHGKMTVEELVGQGQGATSIEIKDTKTVLSDTKKIFYNKYRLIEFMQ